MKKNIAVIVGVVVVVVALALAGYKILNNRNSQKSVRETVKNMMTVNGKTSYSFDGGSILNYSFDIPDTATSTISDDGDLIKVLDGTTTRATVYFSYEGGRGISAVDYITNIVAPHVSVIDVTSTMNIGNYEWQLAETGGSNWYVALLNNGEWIVAVEAKKTFEDQSSLVSSFKAE